MFPSEAMGSLANVVEATHKQAEEVATACADAFDNWERLGAVGGQREDCAAIFLEGVKREMRQMADYSGRIVSQIEAMQANPYAEDDA